jgi:hypothetical protein
VNIAAKFRPQLIGFLERIRELNASIGDEEMLEILSGRKRMARTVQERDAGTWFLSDDLADQFDELAGQLQEIRGPLLAPQDIEKRLRGMVSALQRKDWSESAIPSVADDCLRDIQNFDPRWATIVVPVIGLQMEIPQLTLGPVHLRPVKPGSRIEVLINQFLETDDLSGVERELAHCTAYAAVTALGDCEAIRLSAEKEIGRALDVVRAIFTPRFSSGYVTVDTISRRWSTSLMLQTEKPAACVESARDIALSRLGIESAAYRKVAILRRHRRISFVRNLLRETKRILALDATKRSQMERKFLVGVQRLGQAVKRDSPESKLVQIEFALEAALGGDSQMLASDSIRARLAERAAFLAGKGGVERATIATKVEKYIGLRNAIAHGRDAAVTEKDTDDFGDCVRNVLSALSSGLSRFGKLDDLVQWVWNRKYLR